MQLSQQVIAAYEHLSVLAWQMLQAAKEDEWDRLVGIGQHYSDLVSALKPLDAETVLDEAESQYKKQLINSILADDAETRQRVQSWMYQLQISMQSNRQEQRLLHAYGF